MSDYIKIALENLKTIGISFTNQTKPIITLAPVFVDSVYVLFIPSGADSLITSDGDTFKVREA